jgi:hypothetical protein
MTDKEFRTGVLGGIATIVIPLVLLGLVALVGVAMGVVG